MKRFLCYFLALAIVFTAIPISFSDDLGSGIEAFNAQNYKLAETLFKKELVAKENVSVAYYYLGLIEVKRDNDKMAKTYFENAIKDNVNYSKPYLELMRTYYRLGEVENAKTLIQEIENRKISLLSLNTEAAKVLLVYGDKSKAMSLLRKERSEDARYLWATQQLATIEIEDEKPEQALNTLDLVSKFDTNKFNTNMTKLMAYEKIEDPKSVEQVIAQSEALYKASTPYPEMFDYNLSWLYYKSGNIDKALGEAKKNIGKKVRLDHQYYNMARVYADAGRYDEVVLWLKKAMYENDNVLLAIHSDVIFEKFVKSDVYSALEKTMLLIDGHPYFVYRGDQRVDPILYKNNLLVPVFTSVKTKYNIFQRLGLTFSYSEENRVITTQKGNKTLKFDLNKDNITLNGKAYDYPVHAAINNNVIYVPLNLLTSVYGLKLSSGANGQIYKVTSFTDVTENAWYYDSLGFITANGIIKGYSDGTFKPNALVPVDQFLVMTLNAIGKGDVKSTGGYWAQGYIDAAIRLNIINENDFSSYSKPITRKEAASVINKALKLSKGSYGEALSSKIYDLDAIDEAYQKDVLAVVSEGIITLSEFTSGDFQPDGKVSRASSLIIFARIIEESRRFKF